MLVFIGGIWFAISFVVLIIAAATDNKELGQYAFTSMLIPIAAGVLAMLKHLPPYWDDDW